MQQPSSGVATTRERSWRFTPSNQDFVYEANFFEASKNVGFSLIRYNLLTGRQEILRYPVISEILVFGKKAIRINDEIIDGAALNDVTGISGFVQLSDEVDRGSQAPTLFLSDSPI